jgi:ribosomal protein S12 methylthiotransferase
MVGFPGETEEEFQELVDFVKKVPLDQIGMFKFSLEKEAYAAKLDGQIGEEEKERRLGILAAAQHKTVKKRNKGMIGRKLKAIVEGPHPDSPYLLSARHQGQCPDIDGRIIINDARHGGDKGKIYEVEITDVAGYDLIGRTLAPAGGGKACKKLNLL